MTRARILGSTIALTTMLGVEARAADVDWKVYGFASVAASEVCFYDEKGVARMADGHLRVWTKCVAQQQMDALDIQRDFDGKILETTARKVASYYVPPIAAVEDINFNQALVITQYEMIANISYIKPHSTIFYELNCPQKMMRELSISILVNGQSGFVDKPRPWKFVPPEGNGASLVKLVCPLH
jgi:hypothetical protein